MLTGCGRCSPAPHLRRTGLDLRPAADPAAQAAALARLAGRFDELLEVKLDRLRGLIRRAASGRRLGPEVGWELGQSWGDPAAADLATAVAEAGPPARDALIQDPRTCLPALTVALPGGPGGAWAPRRDLLGSGPADRHVVVEVDNGGAAHLRFGDGRYGAAPPPGARWPRRTGRATAPRETCRPGRSAASCSAGSASRR